MTSPSDRTYLAQDIEVELEAEFLPEPYSDLERESALDRADDRERNRSALEEMKRDRLYGERR